MHEQQAVWRLNLLPYRNVTGLLSGRIAPGLVQHTYVREDENVSARSTSERALYTKPAPETLVSILPAFFIFTKNRLPAGTCCSR